MGQFFNTFKDRYTILFKTVVISNAADTSANVSHVYGPSMKFEFMESPKQNLPLNKINDEVVRALMSGDLKDYIHSVGVEATNQPKVYTCHINFKVNVDAITND